MMTSLDFKRFFAKVEISDQTTDCWIWRGAISAKGYGRFRFAGANRLAYRVLWEEINHRPVTEGCQLHHTCENRACVNPYHLVEANSQKEHSSFHPQPVRDRCAKGHEFTPENTFLRSDGTGRGCKTCRSVAYKRWWHGNRREKVLT